MTEVLTDLVTAIVVTVIPTIFIFLVLGVELKIEQPQLHQLVIGIWILLTLATFRLFRMDKEGGYFK